MNPQLRFDTHLDHWIQAGISNGIDSFPNLVRAMPGVFPSDILHSLHRLTESSFGDLHQIIDSARHSMAGTRVVQESWLPTPHPLDFDWRFADSAAKMLTDVAYTLASSAERIAILGAPTLIPLLADQFQGRSLTVFDRNPLIASHVERHFSNVSNETLDLAYGPDVPRNDMNLVIADPPWYQPEMKAFLWSASRLSRIRGVILCSFPAIGTRPGVVSERRELLSFAASCGLSVVDTRASCIRYASPYFEQNALRAAKIENVPEDWRAGDLFVLRKVSDTETPRDTAIPPVDWIDVTLEGVRFKIRRKKCTSSDPRLISLVHGDVLDSVSRRDPRISSVDVWTMGNRVFGCESTMEFATLLGEMQRHDVSHISAVTSALGKSFKLVSEQVYRIIAAERALM